MSRASSHARKLSLRRTLKRGNSRPRSPIRHPSGRLEDRMAVDLPAGFIATHPGPSPSRGSSEFSELARDIRASGLMRRRYGYYWTKIAAVPVVFAATITGFILLGDTWWQLAVAVVFAVVFTQTAMLGHDAAHRQIFKSG